MQLHQTLRLGTRNSALALKQADMVRQALLAAYPSLAIEIKPMITTGDRNTDRSLADIGGKGLFTKELEEGLLKDQIDAAVHSLKDMETFLHPELVIAAVLEREDPRDALVSRDRKRFHDLPAGTRIGTSSMRRAAQIKIARPDLTIVPFRGNVTTRLEKIKNGVADATLLALAGLKRIGLESEVAEILDTVQFLPAAGQGTIAIECRKEDAAMREMLRAIHHVPTGHTAVAERSLLATIDGSCRTPIGAYAQLNNGQLRLDAMIAKPDGSAHVAARREGNPEDAEALGHDAGLELLAHGGKDWFK